MTLVPRRIDHAVVAVRDLDAAAAFYERLGFHVGARNRHPWGTENRLIQFRTSFVELITVAADADAIPDHAEGRFSFGAFIRDFLREREGMAMLALDSDDAEADAAHFARVGIGSFEPFFFQRKARRPDGSETRVAFTLAFAVNPRVPDAGFFVCQQHHPENFWNPSSQRHDNGASNIIAVGISATDAEADRSFFESLTGGAAFQEQADSLSVTLRGGQLDVVGEDTGPELRFRSITFRTADLDAVSERLRSSGIRVVPGRESLRIPVDGGSGLELRFVPAAS